MRQIRNIGEYYSIVENYKQKGCLSNDYIQNEAADLIIHDKLFAECYERNAFLFVKQNYGTRVYYYINDINEHVDFSQYHNLNVEILYRNVYPEDEVSFLRACGFQDNIIRDQYVAQYSDLKHNSSINPNIIVSLANSIEDVSQACTLFNDTFDRLSGDFIPKNAYQFLLSSKNILVAKSVNNEFLGALHQEKKGTINEIGHIAVDYNYQGHGVGSTLLDAFIQFNMVTGTTRYQLWVKRNNVNAVSMYEQKGFRYNQKSSISLIKQ